MTIHLVSTRRARNTQARDLASPPKKAKKEPQHERQHPTSKKHPSEGFGIAPQKTQKKTNTKGSTRRARNTQARDLASPPKKAKKEPQHERQHPTSKKHPSEGFGIAPRKRQQKNPSTKGSTRRARNTQARDLASPPKKSKKNKHERQHPTSKKHPSEGFGIAPKKGKAALG